MENQHLEIQDIAPYLPYGLKCMWNKSKPYKLIGLQYGNERVNNELWTWKDGKDTLTGYLYECKPILRPMSEVENYFEQLYGMLEHQDVTDYFDADFLDYHDHLEIEDLQNVKPETIPYGTLKVLLKHHFF